MPEFLDALNDHGRAEWYTLMKSLGIAYHSKEKQQMIETNTRLEGIEEIDRLIRIPGKLKEEIEQ